MCLDGLTYGGSFRGYTKGSPASKALGKRSMGMSEIGGGKRWDSQEADS